MNIAVPEPWHAVIRKIAAADRRPILWWLIAKVIEEAEKNGIGDLPTPPWEEDAE